MNADPIQHPSDEQLLSYCRDEASQEVVASIEMHIQNCKECGSKVHDIIRAEIRRSDCE
jgi:hypothetical protein